MNCKLLFYILFFIIYPVTVHAQAYDSLVWSDEFETDGAPDPQNWKHEKGGGGWGNNEIQVYTDSLNNSRIENGVLIIEARKNGTAWTSARLVTQDLQHFTYGRIEFRAKLPSGIGTWPALWTLGQNFRSVGWPSCGEIDVMEEAGKQPDLCRGSLHFPGSNRVGKDVLVINSEKEFHVYAIEWDKDKICFLIDHSLYYTYEPGIKNESTWPFHNPQFILINLSMGGTMGSAIQFETGGKKNGIDPSLTSAKMEIDYVRVYKQAAQLPVVSSDMPAAQLSPVMIYPNPASHWIDIRVESKSNVTILDMQGNLMATKTIEGGLSRMPLQLEAGLYNVRIIGKNQTMNVNKLIIQ